MASRRRQIVQAWNEAQADDLRELPGVARVVRPGSFGTFPERTHGSAPKAPTLDDGPLYTGEWREEVDGNALSVNANLAPEQPTWTQLAALRRPWPFVGFAVDTIGVPAGVNISAALLVLMRSGQALLLQNVIGAGVPALINVTGPQVPQWVAMTGILAGARVALAISHNNPEGPITMKGNLWGYNSPGFGP